jgi:hypothetical protein
MLRVGWPCLTIGAFITRPFNSASVPVILGVKWHHCVTIIHWADKDIVHATHLHQSVVTFFSQSAGSRQNFKESSLCWNCIAKLSEVFASCLSCRNLAIPPFFPGPTGLHDQRRTCQDQGRTRQDQGRIMRRHLDKEHVSHFPCHSPSHHKHNTPSINS